MSHLPFLTGGDISLLASMERLGQRYFDGDQKRDLLEIFGARGCNCMRLRLWCNPSGEDIFTSDLAQTITLGRRIKAAGMLLILDIHYSDTWADPGHQPKPRAWDNLHGATLCETVRRYSRETIEAMCVQGAMPDIVQIGNEITNGMMWPDGAQNQNGDFANLAALIEAGTRGVCEGAGEYSPQIMIHIDRGADGKTTRWFFEAVESHGLTYDLIGQSYYPFFHGVLELFEDNMKRTAETFGKPIVLVEVGASAQRGVWDGADAKSLEFEASPAGQLRYLEAVIRIMRALPDDLGRGVIWWAPEWIAIAGHASSWEGRALFDRAGRALPALDAFAAAQAPPQRN